ncbi:MAG: rhodanese-like domain-containing protein [Desulfobacterales bacterium]
MAKKGFGLCAMVFLALTAVSWAASSGGYNYISAAELQKRLDAREPMILVDICPVEQFAKGHIPGSIETNAYPVDTEEQRSRLARLLPKIQASKDDVIIVCPRGGGGAKKTVDFYKSKGVEEKRLIILEKGMDAWPYATEKK